MIVKKGSTDITTYFHLRLAADGTDATGLTITDIDLQYVRNRTAPAAKVDATALAATDSAHGDNQAIEVDATDQPGVYRVDWPDAAFATGVDKVVLTVKCALVFTESLLVQLVNYDPEDGVRLGLTALPNAAADAAGGLPISDAGGLDLDAQIGTDIDAILVDTGTTLQNELDGIQADTEDIQSKLGTPADTVSADIAAVKVDTAAILVDTNELQTDWTNGGRLDLIVDDILTDTGTTLQAEVDGIQADTEDIQSRLPAALTGGGNIKADVLALSGDATAADRLEALMDGIIVAQVNDVSATTTVFVADGFTEATDDHFIGRLITFLTGDLAGQQTAITDYTGSTQTFTVDALTEAPANDVFFVIH